MEEEDSPIIPLENHQSIDCSIGSYERTMDVPAAVTMSNGGAGNFHYTAGYNDEDDVFDGGSSPYGSSYDASSVSSSVLTSSLSSFEYDGAPPLPRQEKGESEDDDDGSSNDDVLAKMMGSLMENRGVEITHALAERVSCIDSIKWLGHHLPESVVAFLIDEIEVEEAGSGPLDEYDLDDLGQSAQNFDFNASQMPVLNGDDGVYDDSDEHSISHNELEEYPGHLPQHYNQAPSPNDERKHSGPEMYTTNDSEHDGYPEYNNFAPYSNDSSNNVGQMNAYDNSYAQVEAYEPGVSSNEELQEYHGGYNDDYDGDYKNAYHGGYSADCNDSVDRIEPMHDQYASYNDSAQFSHDYEDAYDDDPHYNNDSTAAGFRYGGDENDVDNSGTSLQGPQHHAQEQEMRHRPQRRHSVIGMQATPNAEAMMKEVFGNAEPQPERRIIRRLSVPLVAGSMVASSHSRTEEENEDAAPESAPEPKPRRRMTRRSSMPLVVQSVDASTHGRGKQATGESEPKPLRQMARRSSMPLMARSMDASAPDRRKEEVDEPAPRRRMARRSSMPLVVRSLDATSNGRRNDNWRLTASDHSSSSLRHDLNDYDRLKSSRMRRRGSNVSAHSLSSMLFADTQIGEMSTIGTGIGDALARERTGFDPFPYESDSEKRKQVLLRKDRVMKTRDSILKLSGGLLIGDLQHEFDALDDESEDKNENMYFTDVIPPATRHDCALLFVDISGFTKLSTTLPVEPLSKTINNYFQMIVDEVEAFGGDILKFAGDAVFCEWQATTSNPLDAGDGISLAGSSQGSIEPWHGLGLEECVLTAAACGARIVDKCSDHPVYDGGGSTGTQVATLNVHCGIGFGEVVGVHVGDRESRMEYLILGDPIEQVADAIMMASRGEVVASPEALVILEETAELDPCILNGDMDKPQVIATKSTCFFHPKGTDHVQVDWTVTLQDFNTKPRERLAKRCDDWGLPALTRLRQRMALYVHPVVVNDEFAMKIYPGDRNRAQERHRSEAELRDVYTVFIMPLITARLTGDDEEDCKVLVLLNDIMLIMTRELSRFKGHLRQFIVDDKGVVLIANFGLRGSTFPNMVAERAIPFTTAVQSLLKAELSTECQIGATFDQAYCGVVGGVSRHEYAVLGPSVNLAARLMGNPNNTGFLVDASIKEKAGSRQFRALPPVKAKGYKHLVPIFEPLQIQDPMWNDLAGKFVGRERELDEIVTMAEGVVEKGGPAQFVLVTADAGAGKTALCSQATKLIKDKCSKRGIPHLTICTVCNEGDVFVPFSIIRPLFVEILNYLHDIENPGAPPRDPKEMIDNEEIMAVLNGEVAQDDISESLLHLIQICEMVDIPEQFVEILGKLILTRNRADVVDGPENGSHALMFNSIAQYVVKAFLNCTISFDLVVLALDDVANMDNMSWKVVELLYIHSQNIIMIGTSRPLDEEELKVGDEFWAKLHGEELACGHFMEIVLEPMRQTDVEQLIANNQTDSDAQISLDVKSKGMPNLASEMLAKLYNEDNPLEDPENSNHDSTRASAVSGIDVGNIGEIVLHRMDSLPSSVRTHLNLGAILGSNFELMDVVTVFEQYRGVQKEERLKHAKSVHESLEEAVRKGILEVANKETSIHARYNATDHPYTSHNTIYKFTHDVWRSNILRLTLDEWKKDMHSLIAQSMETVMDSQLANDYRVLTRLFSHWKESGSAKKAATLALKMGRSLEDIGLTHQSLIVYRESLDMWKDMDNSNEVPDESIGMLSMNLLEKLESSDVEHLILLNVALGRCYTNILDPKESISAFQTALNFIHKAPSSILLGDRSIIFPVFSGLFVALRFGHNEDFQYEQGLVKMFLRETKLYNDPVHYSRALAMQAEMLARHGKFDMALETTSDLRDLYNVDEYSAATSRSYGSDRSGQCIAQSALWLEHLGSHEEALDVCDYVLKELLPKMDPQNVCNSYLMLYPVIWVLKQHGRALEAREAFGEFVVHNFVTRLDDRGLTSDRPLHTPIMALLDMVGTDCETGRLEEYTEWVLAEKNGLFGSELNFLMGSAGRTADSITAEMCLLLAHHTKDRVEKTFFVRKGFEVARDAMELTREKEESRGMILAHAQVKPIFDELEVLHSQLPPDRRSRRLSCRW